MSFTSETAKIYGIQKGQKPWNTGLKGYTNTGSFKKGQVSPRKGIKLTQEIKNKLSLSHIGKNIGKKPIWIGKKISASKMGKPQPWNRGEKNYLWKGGITPINTAIRESLEYEEWRRSVFERDNYTCQGCGQVGGYLEADHIKPFSIYIDLRFELSNGRTFCKLCHIKLGWRGSHIKREIQNA